MSDASAAAPPDPTQSMGPIARLCRLLAVSGGVLLLAVAAMVTASVLLRWFGANPVPGDFEIVQMAMAIVVFAFLPLCQVRRGNIAVQTFTSALPRVASRALDALWDLVYAAMAALLAYALMLGALDTYANRTETMVLTVPLWPAIAIAAGLGGFLAIVAASTSLAMLRDGR